MRYFVAVFRKDATILVRRPVVCLSMLLVPAVLALVASFAFQNVLGSPGRLPLAVVDLDRSPQSAQLVADIRAVPQFDVTTQRRAGSTFSESDATSALDHGRRPAVLVIPAGYAAALAAGQRISLPLYSDPAQPGPAGIVQSIVAGDLDRVSLVAATTRIASSLRPGDGSVPALVDQGVSQFLAAPPLMLKTMPARAGSGLPSPWEQTIPGFAILFSARLGSRVWMPTDEERRVYGIGDRLDSLRAARWWHLLGKFVVAFLFGAVQFAVLMVGAHFIFGMRLGSVPALAVMVGAFLLVPISVGVAIAAVFKSFTSAVTFNEAWGTLLPVLGGALVPVSLLPGVLRTVGRFTPHYWALRGMQDVMVRGAGVGDEWRNLLVLVGFAAVVLAVFAPRFSYRTRGAA